MNVLKTIYLTLLVTIMSQLTQKSEYFGFLPDLGWEVKLVHPFYSFHWLRGHKKHINSTLNHDSTQNRWHNIEFSSFFVIFDRKMAAILNFEKFFKIFFQKAPSDPREVIVWKFEGPTSNGLVARALYLYIHIYIHTKLVKLVDRLM